MKKRDVKYIVVVLLIVLGIGLAAIVVISRIGNETNELDGGIVEGEVVAIETCGIPAEEFESGATYKGADGIKTLFPSGYVKGTPLVEILFLRRRQDGETEPFMLETVGLSSKNEGYGPDYGLQGGYGIRLGLTSRPKESRGLIPGNLCMISHYWMPGESNATHTTKPRPGFSVPENLPPNTVYRVKLIVKDEIREQELLAKNLAAMEEQKRIAEEEKITVEFTAVPDPHLVVIYDDGVRSREESPIIIGGDVVEMKGPNKLGGELGVFPAKSRGKCWVYIKRLDKRSIALPKDADIVAGEDKLVELPVSVDKENLTMLRKYKGIAFYASADSRLPLFWSGFQKLISQNPNAAQELSIEILPGTYYVRVGTPKEDEVAIGTVTIKGTDPDPFSVRLPD